MSYFAANESVIRGDVRINEDTGIWFNATLRGDSNYISVGKSSNIQDNCVVHVSAGYPVEIGNFVTIGHGAIIHGCTIKDNALIGMGSIILNGAVIGENCIIGAGSLITKGTVIPDNSLAFGNPAKVVRTLTPEEIKENHENALRYAGFAREELKQIE